MAFWKYLCSKWLKCCMTVFGVLSLKRLAQLLQADGRHPADFKGFLWVKHTFHLQLAVCSNQNLYEKHISFSLGGLSQFVLTCSVKVTVKRGGICVAENVWWRMWLMFPHDFFDTSGAIISYFRNGSLLFNLTWEFCHWWFFRTDLPSLHDSCRARGTFHSRLDGH